MPIGTSQAARYRALSVTGYSSVSRTFLAIDEQQSPPLHYQIQQFRLSSQDADSFGRTIALFCQEMNRLIELGTRPPMPTVIAYFEQEQLQYVVQESINGHSLSHELAQATVWDEAQIRELLRSLIPALQLLHTHHLVHGQIGLDSIVRQKSDRQLVLIGFGIPAFATSPQLEKNGRASVGVDQSAFYGNDLFDLGLVCIQLLTHTPLNQLIEPQQGIGHWQAYLQTSISEALQQVLTKLLHPNGSERYQSPQDMLADLGTLPPVGLTQPPLVEIEASSASLGSTAMPQSWQCVRTLMGHTSWVRSVTVSTDAHHLISGSGDRTIKVWSMQTGELLQTLEGHSTWIRAIAISPDGKTIASGCNDNTVYLWEVATGHSSCTLTGHHDWIRAIAISPNGQTLASGSQDKRIRIWNLSTLEPIQTLAEHKHWVLALDFSPDSQLLASGSRDQTIQLWNPIKNKRYYTVDAHAAEVLAVAISPDGQAIASCSADKTVKLWKLNTGKLLHTFTDYDSAVNTIAFSPDGKLLATGSNDRTIKLWHMGSGTLINTLQGHTGWIWSIAFSPDSQTVISGSWDGSIKLWQRV
ncbi:serine/threonine protein kinase [Oculatella sp. LEGE 06141]|uniref:WD40 domain-containing protein n=1 Tax=Oculatella sp. LEGE 06141 TaxID=1828648 RepID=UPI00351C189D